MTKAEYIEYCRTLPGAVTDSPFESDPDIVIARHKGSGRWFAALLKYNGKDVLNLKCEPMEAEFLRKMYEGVIPAYHMNKRLWNTIFFESDVPNDEIRRMTEASFRLTAKKSVDKTL